VEGQTGMPGQGPTVVVHHHRPTVPSTTTLKPPSAWVQAAPAITSPGSVRRPGVRVRGRLDPTGNHLRPDRPLALPSVRSEATTDAEGGGSRRRSRLAGSQRMHRGAGPPVAALVPKSLATVCGGHDPHGMTCFVMVRRVRNGTSAARVSARVGLASAR
jgi:hypothetical protein